MADMPSNLALVQRRHALVTQVMATWNKRVADLDGWQPTLETVAQLSTEISLLMDWALMRYAEECEQFNTAVAAVVPIHHTQPMPAVRPVRESE